jgi:hypothetical protein
MRDWSPWDNNLYCVVKDNGEFAGVPCVSYEEARELSFQHENSMIFAMHYDPIDPFGFRFQKGLDNN